MVPGSWWRDLGPDGLGRLRDGEGRISVSVLTPVSVVAASENLGVDVAANALSPVATLLAFGLGAALNQSFIVGGTNVSVADGVLVVFLVWALSRRDAILPVPAFVFFGAVTVLSICAALVICPLTLGLAADEEGLVSGLIRLVVALLYVIGGVNAALAGGFRPLLFGFLVSSTAAALLGIANSLVPSAGLAWINWGVTSRLRGFMNDPNFFAVLQCVALVAVVHMPGILRAVKALIAAALVMSVALSGSKTGAVTLVAVLVVSCVVAILVSDTRRQGTALRSLGLLFGLGVGIGAIAIMWSVIVRGLTDLAEWVSPVQRLLPLLEGGGLSEDGSGRTSAWVDGLRVVEASPLVGVGVGNYGNANQAINATELLAHNGFVQWAAEWGLALALVFVAFVLALVIGPYRRPRAGDFAAASQVMSRVAAVMVVPLLVGSVGLSLNNARVFWVLVGALMYWSTRGVPDRRRSAIGAQRGAVASGVSRGLR